MNVAARPPQRAEGEGALRAILDQALYAVVSVDAENRISYANPAAGELWQIPVSEMLGQSLNMLLPMANREGHDAVMDRNRKGGPDTIVGSSRDLPIERSDGSRVWVNLSLTKLPDAEGRMTYTAFLRDISARRGAIEAAQKALGTVGAASEQIARHGATVQELAERTNLLALNASIEAARVGEMGRSFAVVATEVRRLADSTRTAATDIAAEVAQNRESFASVQEMLEDLNH